MKELELVVKTLDDKLAKDIVVIDVRNVNPLCEYFVICTGNNERHLSGIANGLREVAMKGEGLDLKRIEGKTGSSWTLVDLTDVVVHIFSEEGRENYSLEGLWGDLGTVDISKFLK